MKNSVVRNSTKVYAGTMLIKLIVTGKVTVDISLKEKKAEVLCLI